jgi:hypothetical protein
MIGNYVSLLAIKAPSMLRNITALQAHQSYNTDFKHKLLYFSKKLACNILGLVKVIQVSNRCLAMAH